MELTINLPADATRLAVTGAAERNLKLIREALGVNIWSRNGTLRLTGESGAVGRAAQVIKKLQAAGQSGRPMDRQQLLEAIAATQEAHAVQTSGQTDEPLTTEAKLAAGLEVYARGQRVRGQTAGQHAYLQAILEHDLTFCCGPAGTGKTYLAVAAAASMLKNGQVRKLVLVRPAVEAGEKLGFLPGDMQEKVNPYLRPLLDALHDMMEFEQVQRFMACDLIEIIPLAFMRGRTLNDALVILDEAQNTTRSQMLMFLTRMGHGSKMIVTGDTSQIDLEEPTESGLIDAVRRLRHVRGVAMVTLDRADIVRHSLVQRVVEAYGDGADRDGDSAQGPKKTDN